MISFKINKNIANNLDIYARKKLTDAYIKMFAGFTWMNWDKNKSLGQAWQSAMEQAQATVKNADQKNVAGEFLTRVADAHKAHWSKIIMTNKNSDNKTNMTDAEIAKNKEYGKDMIRKSMATINMIMSQHIKHTNIVSHDNTKDTNKSNSLNQGICWCFYRKCMARLHKKNKGKDTWIKISNKQWQFWPAETQTTFYNNN